MKALSIQQPWAWLIVHGPKRIENRRWDTDFRGEFLIHAGKAFDRQHDFPCPVEPPDPRTLARGGIVGIARLVDVVTQSEDPWFAGPYGFVLADVRPLPFFTLPGKLGFFEVDYKPEG